MSAPTPSPELLAAHDVLVDSDRPWQRGLRLLQSRWREGRQLEAGPRPGKPGALLGSRLAMPAAEEALSNFLTPTIGAVVRREVDAARRSGERLISEPRIFDDLLSSQPLCFNLFAELAEDLAQATAWARAQWPGRVERVTRLLFEHSPGRRDERFLGNRTAFDIYLEHTAPGGGEGFIGIEVKYHEDLVVKAAETRRRVTEVADASGLFRPEDLAALQAPPLQQLWFDHLLALSMLQAEPGRWGGRGLYVLLHPAANERCEEVGEAYLRRLLDGGTFQRLTLESVVGVLQATSGRAWVEAFRRRYLG